MTTYANREDLEKCFSQANITDWADKDRDGTLSEDEKLAIDAAIESAEGIIDSHLAKAGYAAPFDSTAFANLPTRLKSLIKHWTVIIAGFHLYTWRGLRDKVNPIEKLYNEVMSQLKAVADGLPLSDMEADIKVNFGTGRDSSAPTDDLTYLQSDAWDW